MLEYIFEKSNFFWIQWCSKTLKNISNKLNWNNVKFCYLWNFLSLVCQNCTYQPEVANLFNENHLQLNCLKDCKDFIIETVRKRPKPWWPIIIILTNDENALNDVRYSRKKRQRLSCRRKTSSYKIKLLRDSFDCRIEFFETMVYRINQDVNFINRMLFSDKSTICLNGHVNCRYGLDRKPYGFNKTSVTPIRSYN
jgi:hypothetical protein